MISPAEPPPLLRITRASAEHDARAVRSRQEATHDAGLVQRFKSGDESAFDEIVARYRPEMFRVALGVLKNHADAEEIAQDTFVRAHGALAEFRGDCSLVTWLHRIAVNLARNRYWYFFRRCRHASVSFNCAFSDDNPATLAELVASAAASPSQEAITREFSALVSACMGRLGASQREILVLRIYVHRSYDEIAREQGVGMGPVKSRIARARERLRLLVVDSCPEFGGDARHVTLCDAMARTLGGVEVIGA